MNRVVADFQVDGIGGGIEQSNGAGVIRALGFKNEIAVVDVVRTEIADRNVKSVVIAVIGDDIVAAIGAELENLAVTRTGKSIVAGAAMQSYIETARRAKRVIARAAVGDNVIAEGRDSVSIGTGIDRNVPRAIVDRIATQRAAYHGISHGV